MTTILKLNEEQQGLKLIQVNDGFVVVSTESDPHLLPLGTTLLHIEDNYYGFRVIEKDSVLGFLMSGKRIYWECLFATTNLNLEGVPVIEEKKLPFDKLCYYDKRNPDCTTDDEDIKEHQENLSKISEKIGYTETCACDNCFYGRDKLANQIIQQAQQNLFTENDLKTAMRFGAIRSKLSVEELDKSLNDLIQSIKQTKVEITFEDNKPIKCIML